MDIASFVKNKKVTIMGLGLNGGGLASAQFFAEHGACVTVTDKKTKEELATSIEKLKGYPNIRYVLGKHEIEDFTNADLVIKNPAVKREGNPFLNHAKKIESDISIFCQYCTAPIIAVTGSKGKSSTVSALHYGLCKAGYNAFLGGNITISPLHFLSSITDSTPVVLELSSWQLNDLKNCQDFKPHISILTPIIPDHQNWYSSMQEYVNDKKIIYKNQDTSDITICDLKNNWNFEKETRAQVSFYTDSKPKNYMYPQSPLVYFNKDGEGILLIDSMEYLLLPRETNVLSFPLKQNLLNAGLALYHYGVPINDIGKILKDYPGLEHRLECFYKSGLCYFYNDTTATVPEATISALATFNDARFTQPILITGGTDKALNFEQLGIEIKKAGAIFLLEGSATELLIKELHKHSISFFGPYPSLVQLLEMVKSFITKKEVAFLNTQKIIPILFSPASTSFGMFKNEFDRGNQFKKLVKDLF
ncbi:MAG: UDP-N-acetylmuramoyl-L-alanine--D-glutamate ligase [Spirochaetaceae bacterium]|nr:UDP-N-acetylmuramoyl-L-alanine--D-glutamate ligase [Spirochaetaceae bacterium]